MSDDDRPRVNLGRAMDIHLRPVTESDLPIFFEHQREPEANAMAAFPARDRDPFMAHWAKILGNESLVAMTVVVDGRVAGNVGCWMQEGQRLIGYWIGKDFWGKGVATHMLSMFLRLVTDRIGASVLCPFFVPTGIHDSHRNRPEAMREERAPTKSELIAQAMTGKAVGSGKVTAAHVAQFVFDALREDRFYVFSHPKALGTVQTRLEDVMRL